MDFRTRRLSTRFKVYSALWVTLAIFRSYSAHAAEGASAPPADPVARGAFGLSKVAQQSRAISEETTRLIESERTRIIEEIEMTGATYWQLISSAETEAESAPNESQRQRILKQLQDAPVLVCGESMTCTCPTFSPDACVRDRRYSDARAIALLMDPCLVPGEDDECAEFRKNRARSAGPKDLRGALRRGMNHGALLISGVENRPSIGPILQRLDQSLADSERMREQLQGSCGGIFPETALTLISRAGLLNDIADPNVRECGRSLLKPPFPETPGFVRLPKSCQKILDEGRWNAWSRARTADIQRTTPTGYRLTCGSRERLEPRILWFGRRAILDLPEGACEGNRALRPRGFLETGLLPYLVKPQFAAKRTSAGALEANASWQICLEELIPDASRSTDKGPSETGTRPSQGDVWGEPILEIQTD